MQGSDKPSREDVSQLRQEARSYLATLRQARRTRLYGALSADKKISQHNPKASAGAKSSAGKTGKRVSIEIAQTDAAVSSDLKAQQDAFNALLQLSGHDVPAHEEAAVSHSSSATPGPSKRAPSKKASVEKPKAEKATTATSKVEALAPPKSTQAARSPASAKTAKASHRQMQRMATRQAARDAAAKARLAAHKAKQNIRDARLTQRDAAAKQREAAASQRKKTASQRSNPSFPGRRSHTEVSLVSNQKNIARPGSSSPPLTALRGIGDAMSRRLEQVGVATVEDLLAVDVADLRQRLGPISALANIEGWHAQARQISKD